ncbi:MAG: DNA-binding protein [Bacteroidetes bacterium]|nr:MAG: DNA-binding protein [Bacteroidota bacterium]
MKNSTLIHDVTPEQITSLFEGLQNQLAELKKNFEPKIPNEYLTRNEVAEMLKCDLSTIHNWTKKGKLIPYGIGNRVYYKRNEVEAVLLPFGKNKGTDKEK